MDPRLKRAGVSGFNKPKRTPNHPKKSHVVVAKEGSKVKTIRFGQQGVTGDRQPTARQKSFKARHAKNIAKGKMSAAYWADKVKVVMATGVAGSTFADELNRLANGGTYPTPDAYQSEQGAANNYAAH
jgi:hypothetical protein